MKKISKLIVLDWDGCGNSVTGGPGVSWDIDGVAALARCIEDIHKWAPKWGFVLDTGRDHCYGLALAEALNLVGTTPGLWSGFEGGLVMCQHKIPWRSEYHPSITEGYREARKSLQHFLVSEVMPRIGGAQEHKEVYLTFNPPPGENIEEYYKKVMGLVEARDELKYFSVTHSITAVDFAPHEGGKEHVIGELAEKNNVKLEDILYIGDSEADIKVGKRVKTFAAPANAPCSVKQEAKIVSPLKAPWGTIDIIKHVVFGEKLGIIYKEGA